MTYERDRIDIPATRAELENRLSGLQRLLTATKLERAAIVWAWTREGERGPGGVGKTDDNVSYSVPAFTALEISGLRGTEAVRKYRQAWQMAIDAGKAPEVKPGDSVEIPPTCECGKDKNGLKPPVDDRDLCTRCGELRWPPMRTGSTRDEWLREDATIDEKISGFKGLMNKDHEFREAVQESMVDEISDDPALTGQVNVRYSEKHPTPEPTIEPRVDLTVGMFGSEVYQAVKQREYAYRQLIAWIQDGPHGPDADTEIRAVLDDLDKAKAIIDQYADGIRQAMGIDYNEQFQRLLREEE